MPAPAPVPAPVPAPAPAPAPVPKDKAATHEVATLRAEAKAHEESAPSRLATAAAPSSLAAKAQTLDEQIASELLDLEDDDDDDDDDDVQDAARTVTDAEALDAEFEKLLG